MHTEIHSQDIAHAKTSKAKALDTKVPKKNNPEFL